MHRKREGVGTSTHLQRGVHVEDDLVDAVQILVSHVVEHPEGLTGEHGWSDEQMERPRVGALVRGLGRGLDEGIDRGLDEGIDRGLGKVGA